MCLWRYTESSQNQTGELQEDKIVFNTHIYHQHIQIHRKILHTHSTRMSGGINLIMTESRSSLSDTNLLQTLQKNSTIYTIGEYLSG